MKDIEVITTVLNEYLKVSQFDFDPGLNGLQIRATKNQEIRHIATAVDATKDVILKAIELKADCLLVHHGVCWGSYSPSVLNFKRVLLEDAGCNLLAYHLPLDAHQGVGNNVALAKYFGVENIRPFGKLPNDHHIGIRGTLDRENLKSFYTKPLLGRVRNNFSSEKIEISSGKIEVAIVSGAGGDYFRDALARGIQLFITGECRYQDGIFMEEGRARGMKVEFLGHHASETLGVRALGDYIKNFFPVRVTHIDMPILL